MDLRTLCDDNSNSEKGNKDTSQETMVVNKLQYCGSKLLFALLYLQ